MCAVHLCDDTFFSQQSIESLHLRFISHLWPLTPRSPLNACPLSPVSPQSVSYILNPLPQWNGPRLVPPASLAALRLRISLINSFMLIRFPSCQSLCTFKNVTALSVPSPRRSLHLAIWLSSFLAAHNSLFCRVSDHLSSAALADVKNVFEGDSDLYGPDLIPPRHANKTPSWFYCLTF